MLKLAEFIKAKKIIIFSAFLLILFIGGIFFSALILQKTSVYKRLSQKRNWRYSLDSQARAYSEAESFVPKSVSRSANIRITLPPEMADKAEAQKKIVFAPAIKGKYLESKEERALIFDPDKPLETGKYYAATLDTGAGAVGGDFLAEDDPAILNVFPKKDTETDENTGITILFNRPMTPLSTLDRMEASNIPVDILPKTEGRFKWIGTRTLQFIPGNTLIASANYTVRIKPEFQSIDGLTAGAYEHKFRTRNLRYEFLSMDELVYDQPFTVAYNQPVDLEKTKQLISVKDGGKEIDTIIEYGRKEVYDEKEKKFVKEPDSSVISVYQKADRFGRARLWDFKKNYQFSVSGGVPAKGDISLAEKRENSLAATGIVKSVSAESEKSQYASQELFDAGGRLIIEFYEEIDLDRSVVSGSRIAGKAYGQSCKKDDEGNEIYAENGCEKETDKRKIALEFDAKQIKRGDKLAIDLEKIVNQDGLQINQATEKLEAKAIPALKVLSSQPAANEKNAPLDSLTLCTNVPLSAPAKEDRAKAFSSNLPLDAKFWANSIPVPDETGGYWKCPPRSFQTDIQYGLMPEADYALAIRLADHFGAESEFKISFKTGKMPERLLNFYHYQEKVLLTTPQKTTLTFAAENMEFVEANICKLSGEDMAKLMLGMPEYFAGPEAVKNCQQNSSHKIELPKRYWVKNVFKFDLKKYVKDPLGAYLLTFSNPDYREWYGEKRRVYERVYLNVSNLGIVEKKINRRAIANTDPGKGIDNLFWVTDLSSLENVEGASLALYEYSDDKKFAKKETLETDRAGIAKSAAKGEVSAVLASKGADTAVLVSDESTLEYASWAQSAKKIYIYTDRPIYRPGDEVNIKGIYRVGYDNDFEIFRDKKIKISVNDSAGGEVLSREEEIGAFGTFNLKLSLKSDAPLGDYYIQTDGGYASFSVEEYVPAAFKVDMSSDREEYVSKDSADVRVSADYYFGVPVDSGTVEYSVGSQDYYFDRYDKDGFSFGSGWYGCYWGCEYNDRFITRGKAGLGRDGKAGIALDLDFSRIFKDEKVRKSKIITVYATAKNSNGQSVSGKKSFIAHAGEFYLGLKTDKTFLGAGESFEASLKSVDTSGKEIRLQGVSFALSRVEWISAKRKQVDGGYYYQSEEKLTPIETWQDDTDAGGDFKKLLAVKDEGQYRLTALREDSRGNAVSAQAEIYVYGEGQASVAPNNDHSLELVADSAELETGGKGSVIIKSPFKKARALISIERGRIFSYEVVPVGQSLYKYEFPVIEDYIPNVYVSVSLVSSGPDIKYGSAQFRVDAKEKELDIAIKSGKQSYLPGEEVRLDLSVTDSEGRPVQAELSLAVVDMSVLALKGNPKKNPARFFYDGFPLTVTTASNYKNILFEVDVPTGTKGGGGAEPEDLARKKRGVFKDTAYWQGIVNTDSGGRAKISFALPDNLTTWQAEAVGVTADTRLGAAYAEFQAKKDLMLAPLLPRFATLGDEFALGAKIFNQTEKAQSLTASIFSPDLEIIDAPQAQIVIPAKESDTVYFRAKAPLASQKGELSFTIKAENRQLADEAQRTVKVRADDTYETVATAGYSAKNASEYAYLPSNIVPDKGRLSITTSATLAVYLGSALDSILGYPYGCSEQISSKLKAIAAAKRGLNVENISDKLSLKPVEFEGRIYTIDELAKAGLEALYRDQLDDGGFAYYSGYGAESNYFLTLSVAETLADLKKAGYKIDDARLNKASAYIIDKTLFDPYYKDSNENLVYAAAVLSDIKFGNPDPRIIGRINRLSSDKAYLNEKIGSLALARLAGHLVAERKSYPENFRKSILDNLENRIQIDARGAFLAPKADAWSWNYYETAANDTAHLLEVLIASNKDNQLLDRILRWLLASRAKDGGWGSTSDTAEVIGAFSDYLLWRQENKADFAISLSLNQNELESYSFTPDNLFNSEVLDIDLSAIPAGKLNRFSFAKTDRNKITNNYYYYDMALRYYLPSASLPPRDEGFAIERAFYALDDKGLANPKSEAKVGDVLKGHIKLTVPKERHLVSVEDFIPAGVELVNFNLATENVSAIGGHEGRESHLDEYGNYDWEWYWKYDRQLRPDRQESHDDRVFLFKENLPEGEYEFDYYVRALVPGRFAWLPARAMEMYFPENFGRTAGGQFVVNE